MTLLIVDDERLTRESLCDFIDWKALGINTVHCASNGLQAFEISSCRPPDIVLCDIKMPKMDGITFCKRLREMSMRCEIIFLSGYPDKENLKEALHIHAMDFLEKPLDTERVTEAVRQAIARRSNSPEADEAPLRRTKVEEIEYYIRQHMGDHALSVGKIAKAFNLNQSYFCTFFKGKTGMLPSEYIVRTRVNEAKKLLTNHAYKLYDIASLVGFTDPDYFSAVFRKYTGMAPSQYRADIGNDGT